MHGKILVCAIPLLLNQVVGQEFKSKKDRALMVLDQMFACQMILCKLYPASRQVPTYQIAQKYLEAGTWMEDVLQQKSIAHVGQAHKNLSERVKTEPDQLFVHILT